MFWASQDYRVGPHLKGRTKSGMVLSPEVITSYSSHLPSFRMAPMFLFWLGFLLLYPDLTEAFSQSGKRVYLKKLLCIENIH